MKPTNPFERSSLLHGQFARAFRHLQARRAAALDHADKHLKKCERERAKEEEYRKMKEMRAAWRTPGPLITGDRTTDD